MPVEFKVTACIAAAADEIYHAWLNSEKHTLMTGGKAVVSDQIDGTFHAWDGYIQGRNLALEPGRRIVQSWRTSEFKDTEPDSQIEICFERAGEGTRITLWHTKLPPHGVQYEQGWIDAYFEPMKIYFEG